MKQDIGKASIALHRKLRGKISVTSKKAIKNRADLALVYTPGVGAVSMAIAKKPLEVRELTWVGNTVAVVSDGSAVLGLGNIGPAAALPVMEGKCAIFKQFANVDAVPIVLATQDVEQIVQTVQALEPSFGAIQLEDISAPRCFEIERRLSESLSIPVMHDDQHGTAIVILAGIMNAMKVTKRRDIKKVKIVLNGAGAAGTAAARLLHAAGFVNVIACDREGAIWKGRPGLNTPKQDLATFTNPTSLKGSLAEVAVGADVLVGISAAGAFTPELIRSMSPRAIVFALANPTPEILPDLAKKAGAVVTATGRSDYPNQLNNALVYPGLFRGMLDRRVKKVDEATKVRAAKALAGFIKNPTADRIVPSIFDKGLHQAIARSVK